MSACGCHGAVDEPIPAVRADRVVHLAGVTIGTPEPVPETLRFHLQTQLGDEVPVDMFMLLAALGFACRKGVIPKLDDDWIARTANLFGVDDLWC